MRKFLKHQLDRIVLSFCKDINNCSGCSLTKCIKNPEFLNKNPNN